VLRQGPKKNGVSSARPGLASVPQGTQLPGAAADNSFMRPYVIYRVDRRGLTAVQLLNAESGPDAVQRCNVSVDWRCEHLEAVSAEYVPSGVVSLLVAHQEADTVEMEAVDELY
jgi:hypothetical protein